jgi:dGTPase
MFGHGIGISYAPFATDPARTRGRLYPEPESETRTVFQRDRDRVIHSAAFRRLKHKTQVFVAHEGDHYRTRMTHSLEVSQIARSICRQLGLNEELAEALALAHDLGHTPFGHAGEDALDRKMADFGGFDHNAQTLRIVTRLEQRYAGFDGLNLTWETLEGVVKHNGPLTGQAVPPPIVDYDAQQSLELDTWPGAEAQVAALADDIAYNSHDLDDGFRARLFGFDEIREVPLVGEAVAEVEASHPGLDNGRKIHETVRRIINRLVSDLLTESRRRLTEAAPQSVEEVRSLGYPVIAFSDAMMDQDRALKSFLRERMYRHYLVNRMTSKARRVVADLFDLFLGEPSLLPDEWQSRIDAPGTGRTARVIADYIAGMTDRFALDEHHKLFDPIL